jgi:hypothetical protein
MVFSISWTHPAGVLKGNCLFTTFDVKKPTAFFSFSNMNKGRKEVNQQINAKC